jgi:hypothetical protein
MLNIPALINQAVAAVTGFTSATFTTVASSTTVPNGKSYTVTAKGGTQPVAVDVHSASRPFSFLCTRPQTIQQLPPLNTAGTLPNVPINVYTLGVRKGLTVYAGQPSSAGYCKISIGIPAGADLADPDNVAAMLLCSSMTLAQMAQDIINTAKSGEI